MLILSDGGPQCQSSTVDKQEEQRWSSSDENQVFHFVHIHMTNTMTEYFHLELQWTNDSLIKADSDSQGFIRHDS